MATTANIDFYRAEDVTLTYVWNQSNGTSPQNITGWTIAFRAATTQYGAAVITKTATLTSPTTGTFTVSLASADTSALTQDGADTVYYYDIRRTDSGSRTEMFVGTMTVHDTPTNS